jgi:hypothetical protein
MKTIMDITGTVYRKVKWKNYLLPENNPRIERFLKTNGNLIYSQILEDIKDALNHGIKEILIAPHRNSIHLISVTYDEFDEILDYSLEWFLEIENYEECAIIRDLKIRLEDK